MAFPALVRWPRSRWLLAFILSGHASGAIALKLAALDRPWLVASMALLAVSAIHAVRTWHGAQGELLLHQDGRCEFRCPGEHEFRPARLLAHHRWPALASLSLACSEPESRQLLIDAPGVLTPAERHQINLWLRCCAGADAAEPGRDSA